MQVKRESKRLCAQWINRKFGFSVDPETIFDCHIKRIHEYKRQLLNALRIVVLYNRLRQTILNRFDRRGRFFSPAKPRAAYLYCKAHHQVHRELGPDDCRGSGRERAVARHFFARLRCFTGAKTDSRERRFESDLHRRLRGQRHEQHEVHDERRLDDGNPRRRNDRNGRQKRARRISCCSASLRSRLPTAAAGTIPRWHYDHDPETRAALDLIASGHFSGSDPKLFQPLYDLLMHGDRYMHLADLNSYLEADQRMRDWYANPRDWARKAVLNVASSGQVFERPHRSREYATGHLGREGLSGVIGRICA